MTPGGVLILSEHDEESLDGVLDPYVRFLLVQKTTRDAGVMASARS